MVGNSADVFIACAFVQMPLSQPEGASASSGQVICGEKAHEVQRNLIHRGRSLRQGVESKSIARAVQAACTLSWMAPRFCMLLQFGRQGTWINLSACCLEWPKP